MLPLNDRLNHWPTADYTSTERTEQAFIQQLTPILVFHSQILRTEGFNSNPNRSAILLLWFVVNIII